MRVAVVAAVKRSRAREPRSSKDFTSVPANEDGEAAEPYRVRRATKTINLPGVANEESVASGGAVLWRSVFEQYRFGRMTLLAPAPLLYIRTVLRRRVAERKFIKKASSHLLYVVLISLMIFMQRSVSDAQALESSISTFFAGLSARSASGALIKLHTISSLDELWTWTNDAVMPVTLTQAQRLDDGRIVLRMYNQLIGSVRLSQKRVAKGTCSGSPRLGNQYASCYGVWSLDNNDASAFGPWHDEAYYTASKGFSGYSQFTIDLGSDPGYAVERVRELRSTGWADHTMREMSIDMLYCACMRSSNRWPRLHPAHTCSNPVLADNNAFDLFCSTRLVFTLNPAGRVRVSQYYETVPADNYSRDIDYVRLVVELLLALMALRRMSDGLLEVRRYWRDPDLRVADFLTSAGNIVDWLSLISLSFGFYTWIEIQWYGLYGIDLRGDGASAIEATDRILFVSTKWKLYTVLNCVNLLLALFTFFNVFGGRENRALTLTLTLALTLILALTLTPEP